MAIKIGSLTSGERRDAKVLLTVEENGEVRQEEIRVSFKKPTEALWRKVVSMEERENAEEVCVDQLMALDIQSPDITNDDGTVHQITRQDLLALDAVQIAQLWAGIKEHFFLRTPAKPQETDSSFSSAQAAG
jgi:hypothetical protein